MRKIKYKQPQDWMTEGTEVYYHPIIKDPHDSVVRKIEGKPWQLGHGQWVVNVTGKSGGVCLEAITQLKNLDQSEGE